ncbi:Gnat family [Mycena sanguinolenta]|uniref:Gnat family n=1 Tax=Mycena sanguinolenta TaxID=230812 RepID=A0A8H7DE55_9AGAR|nr:Gnat family [Mycena sanguinolenta]
MTGLEYNSTTGEPFLRLPAPFSSFIITPPRMADVARSVEIMNDPFVFKWMGRSTPYSVDLATAWLMKVKAQTDVAVEELRNSTEFGPVSGCPVRHIREELPDGTDVFIGDVGLVRSGWTEVLDAEERVRFVTENNARAAGDPEIAWHIGYYLAPGYNGRGLMTAAVKTIITQFGIPQMNTKYIRSSAFEGNHGSLKVLQKNDFVMVDTLVEHVRVGDEKTTLHLMEWRAS